MSDKYTQLRVRVRIGEGAEFVSLARRCSTTPRTLGSIVVRQVLVAAKTDSLSEIEPLEQSMSNLGVAIWIEPDDLDALRDAATRTGRTIGDLLSSGVRHLLAQARKGALPMVSSLKPEPEPLESSMPVSVSGAQLNLDKARLIVDRLHFISEWGLNDQSRAALKEIEGLKTISPD